MDYNFSQDLISIRKILGLTQMQFAKELGVEQTTISRNETGQNRPSDKLLELVYAYAFRKNIQMNRLKEMLWTENISRNHVLLFHGAKSNIEGNINIKVGRTNNDFGQGFYTGERYDQAIAFISGFPKSSVYFLDFAPSGLIEKRYHVDQEWMLTIAYNRGKLEKYKEHPMIKKTIEKSKACDYIVAPIADNRMFQIINSFIDGEITDEQCKHCLAATNLGMQYVFLSNKAVNHLSLIERCYVSKKEKEHYQNIRIRDSKLGDDKVKLARIQYRGKGLYIDEILK